MGLSWRSCLILVVRAFVLSSDTLYNRKARSEADTAQDDSDSALLFRDAQRDKKLLHMQEQQHSSTTTPPRRASTSWNTSPTLSTLQENVRVIRAVDHVKALTSISSHWHVTSPDYPGCECPALEMIPVPVRLRCKYFGLGRIILSGTIENITGLRLRSLVYIESCSNLLEYMLLVPML